MWLVLKRDFSLLVWITLQPLTSLTNARNPFSSLPHLSDFCWLSSVFPLAHPQQTIQVLWLILPHLQQMYFVCSVVLPILGWHLTFNSVTGEEVLQIFMPYLHGCCTLSVPRDSSHIKVKISTRVCCESLGRSLLRAMPSPQAQCGRASNVFWQAGFRVLTSKMEIKP